MTTTEPIYLEGVFLIDIVDGSPATIPGNWTRFDERGITFKGSDDTHSKSFLYGEIRNITVGSPARLYDGSDGWEIDILLADRSVSFLVPMARYGQDWVTSLSAHINNWQALSKTSFSQPNDVPVSVPTVQSNQITTVVPPAAFYQGHVDQGQSRSMTSVSSKSKKKKVVLLGGVVTVLVAALVAVAVIMMSSSPLSGPPAGTSLAAVGPEMSLQPSDLPSTFATTIVGNECSPTSHSAQICQNSSYNGGVAALASCLSLPQSDIASVLGNYVNGSDVYLSNNFKIESLNTTLPSAITSMVKDSTSLQSSAQLFATTSEEAEVIAALQSSLGASCFTQMLKNNLLPGIQNSVAGAGIKLTVTSPVQITVPSYSGLKITGFSVGFIMNLPSPIGNFSSIEFNFYLYIAGAGRVVESMLATDTSPVRIPESVKTQAFKDVEAGLYSVVSK